MRFTHLDDWLRWQESCHPSAIDLGLTRVRKVAERLGLLDPNATIITVAGTNGKGTCVAALETLLLNAGVSCAVYSSPHILHYRERIRVAGQYASDEAICRAFDAIDRARGEISLTYFEFGTLAAFFLFREAGVAYWVVEVGLGGRLDATNILDADITVITSIALDHTEWLGSDRDSIGREKAGICRAGVPLVCADPDPPTTVLQAAMELGCPFYSITRDFGFCEENARTVFWVADQKSDPVPARLPKPSLAAALQVIRLLGVYGNLPVHLLARIELPGRMQYWDGRGRTVILDVAHNPAAFLYLAEQLRQRHPADRFQIVVAMMADKDLSTSLNAFADIASDWFPTTIKDLPRAAPAERLLESLPSHNSTKTYVDVDEALAKALRATTGPVLVTGSFYTVAEAMRFLPTQGIFPVRDSQTGQDIYPDERSD